MSPRRAAVPPRPAAMRLPTLGAALAVAVALTACAEPELPEGTDDEEEATEPAPETEQLDLSRDALVAEVETLTGTVTEARDHLQAAVDADDVTAARAEGRAAVAWLVDDPELAGTAAAVPLFPGETADRADAVDGDDALSSTVAAARATGDPLGRAVVDHLQDPVAGDLGAWQRDAAGVLQLVRAVAVPGTDLEQLQSNVLELPGEGTRALAWALALSEAATLSDAVAYAERGLAHLDVVLAALDGLDVDDADEAAGGAAGDGA